MKIDDEPVYIYKKQAEKLKINNKTTMIIDLRHFFDYDKNYDSRKYILGNFYRFSPFVDRAVKDFMIDIDAEWARERKFVASFINVPEILKIRQLKTSQLGKLTSITGTITRTSEKKHSDLTYHHEVRCTYHGLS